MRFQNVIILNLLIIIVPLLVFVYFRIIRHQKRLAGFMGDKHLIKKLIGSVNFKMKKRKLQLVLLALIIILLALARPQFGNVTVEAKRKGVDVIIALDTSQSMLAEDIAPNRIDKAKQEINKLISALKGDRVGLLGFAGTAFVLCPLTLDKEAARMFLSILDNELMPVQGTAISKAIDTARQSFSKKERKYKALILITDGEDHYGSAVQAAYKAKEEGIKIFTIGIGDVSGNPIPIKDKKGNNIGFKKDQNGKVVVSRLDEQTLKEIAAVSDGQYYRVASGDWGLYRIYEQVSVLDKKELKSKMVTIFEEKYQYLLVFALLFLILEVFLPERRKVKINIDVSGNV